MESRGGTSTAHVLALGGEWTREASGSCLLLQSEIKERVGSICNSFCLDLVIVL